MIEMVIGGNINPVMDMEIVAEIIYQQVLIIT